MSETRNQSSNAKSRTTVEMRGEREMVVARTFRAPQRLVFEAWTKAELVERWWAPRSRGAEIVGCTADVRVGGTYRYVTRAAGTEFAFSGEYREVTPHSRLVYTVVFEPMADAGAVVATVTFEDLGESTRLVSHEIYPSKEAMDAAVASGMEGGIHETMDQLDELVAQQAAR